MDPKTYRKKQQEEKRNHMYRASVRQHSSILKHLMVTGLTKQSEINRAYSKLALVDKKSMVPNSPELKATTCFVKISNNL